MDDDFTARVIQRARERQRKLQELNGATEKPATRKEVVSDSCLFVGEKGANAPLKENSSEGNLVKSLRQSSRTQVSSEMPGSPRNQLKTLNIQKEDFNMEIKVSSTDNVRLEVQIEDGDDVEGDENNGAGLREDAKSRLRRLGKLYAGGDDAEISSPIHRTEATFHINDDSSAKSTKPQTVSSKTDTDNTEKPRKGLGRLADLAQNINQWEDEIAKKEPKKLSPSKRSWKPKAPQPPVAASPVKKTETPKKKPAPPTPTKANETGGAPKQLNFDRNILETLESQGFTRTTSNSRLVYNYSQAKKDEKKVEAIKEENEENVVKNEGRTKKVGEISSPGRRCPGIASKAAVFEGSPSKMKDPALLSVAERKALFEKNKGEVVMPKPAAFVAAKKPPAPKPPLLAKPAIETATGIASKMAALLESKTTIAQAQIESGVKQQRQKEMDVLLNRFNRNKEERSEDADESEEEDDETTVMIKGEAKKSVKILTPPPLPPVQTSTNKRLSKGDSPKVAAVLQDVKRIKVTETNKPGRLYPCLSDIETATETETETAANTPEPDTSFDDSILDSDSANTSFGRDILQAVCCNKSQMTPQKRSICDDSTASDISDVLEDMNTDYLDEVAAYQPTPPKLGKITSPTNKGTKPSTSFSYKSFQSPKVTVQTTPKTTAVSSPRKSEDLPSYIVDGDNVLPLTHTVSFYRKQQTQASNTPVKKIIRQPVVAEEEEEEKEENTDDSLAVENKIAELLEEVRKQELMISQTSQALNLCNSTLEFMGSTEQVEAEKVLLLATHRRQVVLNEVQRLRVERTLRPQGQYAQNVPLEKGTLEISEITFPLKKEYVRALSAAGGKGHHVVCLVKCNEQVVTTKLVSTVASSSKNPDLELKIPGTVVLKNVYSDFMVTLEVYCLQAQEELLPHDVKYHINNKKPSSKLTPRKAKQDSRMVKPPKESPAGPAAVRSPTFALMGYVVFSIQQINKTHWSLNKAPPMSPLEGSVNMKIDCELAVSVEHRGFLTMFEDVSGFGAWHRRWCLLKGSALNYWKYPDDEKKLPPIDTIDLNSCITKEVGPVKRDICARAHTILLERERIAQPEDKDTLTTVRQGKTTIIRHLLSADTKEERIQWCTKINTALTAIRMWGKS